MDKVAYKKLVDGKWVASTMPREVMRELVRNGKCEERNGSMRVEVGGETMLFEEVR